MSDEKQFVIRLTGRDANRQSLYVSTTGEHNFQKVPFDQAGRFESLAFCENLLKSLSILEFTAFVHPLENYSGQIVLGESVADNLPIPTVEFLRSKGPKHYIVALANSFPCLRGKCELCNVTPENWDVDRWVKMSGPWSHSERQAALFIAMVWNWSDAVSKKWRFDAVDAVSVWDRGNTMAFIAWAKNPVWP